MPFIVREALASKACRGELIGSKKLTSVYLLTRLFCFFKSIANTQAQLCLEILSIAKRHNHCLPHWASVGFRSSAPTDARRCYSYTSCQRKMNRHIIGSFVLRLEKIPLVSLKSTSLNFAHPGKISNGRMGTRIGG